MTLAYSSPRLEFRGANTPTFDAIWTADAERFITDLVYRFSSRVDTLLQKRIERQKKFDAGIMPDFLAETSDVRNSAWKVAPIVHDLLDRRVEITGPVDKKIIINALNSGAKVFMADFEDSSTPTWDNMVEGQLNLKEAIRGSLEYKSPDDKIYKLNTSTAVLMVRPRGWHLPEKHVLMNERPIPGALMDFGLYFFHNLQALLDKNTAPYFYLPKMESHLEARLWNDIFVYAQDCLSVPRGTVRATCLIETLPAAFEMDEFLFELRDHSAGLNCGRWDYIFNFIKCFRAHPDYVLPNRDQLGMTTHFLRSYSKLLIKTCHRRGVHAMGGMAAQIPNKADPVANQKAMEKVTADKEREVSDGHDGTWVGHPGLVSVAKAVFDRGMPGPNQIHHTHDDTITTKDLLECPKGTITEKGLENNISVALRYMESWLRGQGCVPIDHLMEDAATAEISRTQIWQWLRYPNGKFEDGRRITLDLVRDILNQELMQLREQYGKEYNQRHYETAARLLDRMASSEVLPNFLTLEAYQLLS